jgi:opacity protein-like surface antigen
MKKIILLTLIAWGSLNLSGQTFKAYLATGLNAGQIDGDFEVGYNKIGFQGGLGIGLNLSQNWFLSTEFLFSRRGSKNSLFMSNSEANGQITLDYIDLPIIVRLGDWYVEEGKYNKVWLEAGISAGRLINASLIGSNVPEIVDDFRSTDVSFIGGIGYNINKNFFTNLRYTRSLYPFYKNPDASPLEVSYFTSYFLSLRVGYSL